MTWMIVAVDTIHEDFLVENWVLRFSSHKSGLLQCTCKHVSSTMCARGNECLIRFPLVIEGMVVHGLYTGKDSGSCHGRFAVHFQNISCLNCTHAWKNTDTKFWLTALWATGTLRWLSLLKDIFIYRIQNTSMFWTMLPRCIQTTSMKEFQMPYHVCTQVHS